MSFLGKIFGRTEAFNLTICGLDRAGKTTFVNYLIYGQFRDTIPTMGLNRETIEFKNLKFKVWDLGGQESFRKTLWSQINENSDALIYIVDSADVARLDQSKKIFYDIIKTQIQKDIPVLILLNKVDLPDRISRVDFMSKFDLTSGKNDFKWACFETSSKTGAGIVDAFNYFVRMIS